MAEYRDLLVEIGTEELPPKALKTLSEAFLSGVKRGLEQEGLVYTAARCYAAPRRLAVYVEALVTTQAEKQLERRGPALTAAFDESGMPSKALLGFARSCGVEVEQLERLESDKGSWWVHRTLQAGQTTAALVPAIVNKALADLPIPKRMRWGSGTAEFVRPVHWVVMLLGEALVPGEILGIMAGRETRGHRFHHPHPIYLGEAAAYAPLLETEGHVMADFAVRREAIRAQVMEAAAAVDGRAVLDEALLDEVTALVEWPVAVRGQFEERFLQVPEEALISSMQGHQKYFPVKDRAGKLLPYFITIANIASKNIASVRQGNERVIRPRLEDAMFFYVRDREQPLVNHNQALKSVVFQKQLGTLYDKVQRTKVLAHYIGMELGFNSEELRHAARAAELAKCDLMTGMVGEFPELQGIMGRNYALAQGEPAEVAYALDELYMPRHAGDQLPPSRLGAVLALADKMDTLCGIVAAGLVPTGDKDPFALRRAALGMVRIMIEKGLPLDLRQLITAALQPLSDLKTTLSGKPVTSAERIDLIFNFMMERLRAYYHDQGVPPDLFDAVLAREPQQPYDFDRRIRAVVNFRQLSAASALAAANKRSSNILRQAAGEQTEAVDVALLIEPQEQRLYEALTAAAQAVEPLLQRGDYTEALTELAALRESVDSFFDQVMVMAEDTALRRNRLALLQRLHTLFLRVADLSKLQG